MSTIAAATRAGLALTALLSAGAVDAQDQGDGATGNSAPTPSNDKLILSANGSTLPDQEDGFGGLFRWLHNFSPSTQLGIGGEYQSIAGAHWTVGTLTGSWNRAAASGARTSLYGEVTYGEGRIEDRAYDHVISALGLVQSFPGGFSIQLEDRQIDVDRTHGNLPKLALSYLWGKRFLASVSYANSVSGNLGTEIYATRMDLYTRPINLILGAAYGDAAPAVVNLQTGVVQPALELREGFIGIAKPFPGGEFTAVGDYLELAETERITLTLSLTIHLR